MYDGYVRRRNTKIVDAAARSNAIVLSLFPSHVRDRLLKQRDWKNVNTPNPDDKARLLTSDHSDSMHYDLSSSAPIAELFPSASVSKLISQAQNGTVYYPDALIIFCFDTKVFADIVGFTSWSSARAPSSVFVLLENLYGEFDKYVNRL